jgi:hypothetical protein
MAVKIPDQQKFTGSFIPTTQVWNVSEIYAADLDDKLEELFVRMYQNLGLMSDVLNRTVWGFRLNETTVSGKRYSNPTNIGEMNLIPSFNMAINTGIVAPGVTTKAHGLTIGSTWTFVQLIGAVSNFATHNYYPLPFADAVGGGANNIQLEVNATNIVITNNTAITFANSIVYLEWTEIAI